MQSSFKEYFQLIIIPKVVRLKIGEVLYEKAYMSPRPPPKISLRNERTRELGSKVVQQPEGEVARQAKFFQPTQPIPSPNCDRSGQLDITQDVIRKTSRSQEISVNSFYKELCSSDRSGQLDITQDVVSVQACSSEDNKSLNVEQTHDRSGQLDEHNVAVQDDPEVHHEIKTLNTDKETIRERIEEDMDFKIPGLPHSASVRELIQKIENHPKRHALQRDLRQSHSFNPFSPESKQMVHEVGNIELCELLDTEPKTQCKVCVSYWDIGIVCCTCGHFLRKGREENQKFIKYTMDLLSIPDYYIKKGRPHGHRYGKKPGDREYCSANQLKNKCKNKFFQGIHDRFIRDETFLSRMIEIGRTEDLCRQMDDLVDEDHTHHLTPQEYYNYKSIWWLRSNKIGSDTMLIRHRSDFKQALSTLQQLKEKEEGAERNQRWAQSSSSSWWSWQGSWWTPHSYESLHGDEPSTDCTGQPVKQVIGTILQGMNFLNSFTLLQLDRLRLTTVFKNRRRV